MTNLDGVFAAGDIVSIASPVVWGIWDGRDVAASMEQYLRAPGDGSQQSARSMTELPPTSRDQNAGE